MSEPAPEVLAIREYELRLIRCTLTSNSRFQSQFSDQTLTAANDFDSTINNLILSIENGSYLEVLNSDASRLAFKLGSSSLSSLDNSIEGADRVYSELLERVESFIKGSTVNDPERAYRIILVMCIAVAAFLSFTQSAITGPSTEMPRSPLSLEAGEGDECPEWENWARNQLMSAGSDLLGKFSNLQEQYCP